VTDELRRSIVTRKFAPGERLTEEALAAAYGVSRVPIREALRTLEVEGFIRIEPYTGTIVATLSDQEALDLLEVRLAVEELACRRAASRRTERDLEELRGVVLAARDAIAAGDKERILELNSQFHLLLAAASGNSSLRQLIEQLQFKIQWVYSAQIIEQADDSWTEHEQLVDALAARDEDRAAMLIREDIGKAQAAYSHQAPASALTKRSRRRL
jgi:DNA-binding GntR family transcriptional regulator